MKDTAKGILAQQIKPKDLSNAAARHFTVAILSFAASRAKIANGLLPFGISLLAGCPAVFSPAAAVGAFIGYFFPAISGSGFRYIAALLSVLAIKLMLSGYKKIVSSPIFLSFVTLLATGITGMISVIGEDLSFLTVFAESLLSALGTFFVCKVAKALSLRTAGLSGEEMACLLTVISFELIGFMPFEIYGISLGRVMAIVLLFISGKYGGTLSGAAAGIAVAISVALYGQNDICVFFALAGLLSGLFSLYGRWCQIAAVILGAIVCTFLCNFSGTSLTIIAESAIAGLGFVAIPKNAGAKFCRLFSCQPKVGPQKGVKKTVDMRLKNAAFALEEVAQTVENVSVQLSKINAPDFGKVIEEIELSGCAGCKLRIHCWESRRSHTVDAIVEMTKAVRQGITAPDGCAPDEFKMRCIRLNKIGQITAVKFGEYVAKTAAESRIEEVRSVVSDQFGGMSNMLIELANDLSLTEKYDAALALSCAEALKTLNIVAKESSAKTDRFGRLSLEFCISNDKDLILNRFQIMRLLSVTCERELEPPVINRTSGDLFMTLCEKSVYKVDIGIEQINANENAMCGDTCRYFNDGKGHIIMILSDGMGTGGRAAVDSAMACGLMAQMLKAGFGYDCSLKMLNSSMLFKSTDESLATLDIASIDLFTGKTELYKAGAAPTIVRRNGRSGKAQSTSLPVGILRDVGFDRAEIKLKNKDILLLLSDGVTSEGTDWIRVEIETWSEGRAQELAERIAESARRRVTRADDITVLAAIVEKKE